MKFCIQILINQLKLAQTSQIFRYLINGLLATGIHFSILQFNLKILAISSTGQADFIAAIFGISASYIGSRRFVFSSRQQPVFSQALRFAILYFTIAFFHGLFLYEWSDIQGKDYRTGFILATILQVLFSYYGNKMLVFNTSIKWLSLQNYDNHKMKKIYLGLLTSVIFIILLLLIYFIHITYFQIDVILYSSIEDGILASIITAYLLFSWQIFKLFNKFEKLQLTLSCVLCGYIFAISIPTVIDRSLSVYILEKIQQRGGGILLNQFEEVFTKEYVKEHRLVDVRLTEQEASGTIKIENDCVKLTSRGQHIAWLSRYFRLNLLPKQRLLMGQYSDELTDPFRHSEKATNYECQ